MHKDQRDLIIQLCAQAGMEMEDAVTDALKISSIDNEEFLQAIKRLEVSSAKIAALIAAARALSGPNS